MLTLLLKMVIYPQHVQLPLPSYVVFKTHPSLTYSYFLGFLTVVVISPNYNVSYMRAEDFSVLFTDISQDQLKPQNRIHSKQTFSNFLFTEQMIGLHYPLSQVGHTRLAFNNSWYK